DAGELFSKDYGYFSAMSASWLAHAEKYVAMAQERFALGAQSTIVEVAANDGYLLQFAQKRGIPAYGIEPTASTAAAARKRGIEIVEAFFGEELGRSLAAEGRQADLMVANNVLAHVPDINDFVRGFAALLKPHGVATFEFPHLMRLMEGLQFDTVYHEHFSYLSLGVVMRILDAAGLTVFDVEELPTHGGSLRVFAAHPGAFAVTDAPSRVVQAERDAGLEDPETYAAFQADAEGVKNGFVEALIRYRREGLKVAAYGAAAKGNTLLNFAGIRSDLLSLVADKSPGKVGKFMPGSRIYIVTPDELLAAKPDRIVILPWNIAPEIAAQLEPARAWGAKFVTAVPELREF
ncbi:MAG: class I SAM-dependent methyltransferase, partial [Pseudomonadota bacterium]